MVRAAADVVAGVVEVADEARVTDAGAVESEGAVAPRGRYIPAYTISPTVAVDTEIARAMMPANTNALVLGQRIKGLPRLRHSGHGKGGLVGRWSERRMKHAPDADPKDDH